MELGIYRLAEINKGGGLRQKAVGLETQYLNGVGGWVDMPTAMTPTAHSHDIPNLHCGVTDIVAGRILISGSGKTSNPTWLSAGATGKILGWTSGSPAWVDAPSSGRARNIRFMTESGAIDHTSGTDTLIIVTSSSDAVLTLPTSATTGDRIEFYSTLATASFACASAKIWPIKNSSGKVTSWGGGMGAPAYSFAIWDGTYWRVGYLSVQY